MQRSDAYARGLLPLVIGLAGFSSRASAQIASRSAPAAPPALIEVAMPAQHGTTLVRLTDPFVDVVANPAADTVYPPGRVIGGVQIRHSEGAACTKVALVSAKLLDGAPSPPARRDPTGSGEKLPLFEAATQQINLCTFDYRDHGLGIYIYWPWWLTNRFLPACTPDRLRAGWTGFVDMGRLEIRLVYQNWSDENTPPDVLVRNVRARVECRAGKPGT